VIYGGKGADVLFGSYGRDVFVFDTKLGRSEIDTIRSFNVKDDTIKLENAIFTKVGGRGWLKAGAFHIGSKAADKNDRIIYDEKKGSLYYDKDGAGGSAQVQFAKIDKHLKLTYLDFQII
jgi:Ca2+-binding RTX toxin-like protein